ncbi:MAG: hypothetical protein ACKVU2_10225 [Saprospiraceae bacterium]
MAGLFWLAFAQAQNSNGLSFHALDRWVAGVENHGHRLVLPIPNGAFSPVATNEHKIDLSEISFTPPFTPPALCHWSADALPFFCRVEYKIGLKIPIPIKFRLGSVEYVDWLEGKGETYFLHH